MGQDHSVDLERRRFLGQVTAALGCLSLAAVATPFISSWLPSSRTLAQGGPVEVDLSHLLPGALLTVAWRGQPIWIVRRTQDELDALNHNENYLRDPNSHVPQQPSYAQNLYRSLKPEILVLVGVCTHLGCVPVYKPEKGTLFPDGKGGFYCPCHGSKYDLAGRVYKDVPAPSNLVVPPYRFMSDSRIMIGEDPMSH